MSQCNIFLAYIFHFDMVLMMLIFALVSSFLFSFRVQGYNKRQSMKFHGCLDLHDQQITGVSTPMAYPFI